MTRWVADPTIGVDVDTGFVRLAADGYQGAENGAVVPSDRGVVAPGLAAPLVSDAPAPVPAIAVGGSAVAAVPATVVLAIVAVAGVAAAAAADGTSATVPADAFLEGRFAAAGNSAIAGRAAVLASTAVAV